MVPDTKNEYSRILIIDDDENFCKICKTLLEETGRYHIDTANSGHEGLVLARRRDPDLILLDVLMPGMNGYDVSRELSRDDATRHIPYIFVTATLNEHEIIVKITNHYIGKPVDMEDLVNAMEKAIDDKKESGRRVNRRVAHSMYLNN